MYLHLYFNLHTIKTEIQGKEKFMNKKEKEIVAMMALESKNALDAMRKVFEETPDIPEDIKEKAFKEIIKTEKQVIKFTSTKRHPKKN
jgi:hypothetical protein